MDGFKGQRIGKGQAVGMEHESLSAFRVIERIPDNWMPMMGEMNANLMGTARLELAFDQAVSSDFFQLCHLSFCVLTLSWIDQAFAPIMAIASDFILVDDSFLC